LFVSGSLILPFKYPRFLFLKYLLAPPPSPIQFRVWMCLLIYVSQLFFPVALRPNSGPWHPPPPYVASRSHSLYTPHFVGLLWKSDQPDTETSTLQHTNSQQTDVRDPGGIRIHNPSKQAAEGPRLRLRSHWDRQCKPNSALEILTLQKLCRILCRLTVRGLLVSGISSNSHGSRCGNCIPQSDRWVRSPASNVDFVHQCFSAQYRSVIARGVCDMHNRPISNPRGGTQG
jgi:hypothetical protein